MFVWQIWCDQTENINFDFLFITIVNMLLVNGDYSICMCVSMGVCAAATLSKTIFDWQNITFNITHIRHSNSRNIYLLNASKDGTDEII